MRDEPLRKSCSSCTNFRLMADGRIFGCHLTHRACYVTLAELRQAEKCPNYTVEPTCFSSNVVRSRFVNMADEAFKYANFGWGDSNLQVGTSSTVPIEEDAKSCIVNTPKRQDGTCYKKEIKNKRSLRDIIAGLFKLKEVGNAKITS